jgi:hypothetical protein
MKIVRGTYDSKDNTTVSFISCVSKGKLIIRFHAFSGSYWSISDEIVYSKTDASDRTSFLFSQFGYAESDSALVLGRVPAL